MTSPLRTFPTGPKLFLVSIGHVSPIELTQLHRLYPDSGLIVTESLPNGSAAHLSIAVPDDLLGFADLQSVALFKPVCLPLQLVHIAEYRIRARLRTDPAARQLAATVLRALIQSTDPART